MGMEGCLAENNSVMANPNCPRPYTAIFFGGAAVIATEGEFEAMAMYSSGGQVLLISRGSKTTKLFFSNGKLLSWPFSFHLAL